jgi:putative endonuclease
MWCVYFLKSSLDNWYYVGSTNDLGRRLLEHNARKVRSTKLHVPLEIVYVENCENEADAREYERRIKKQRLLKERIIRTITES